MLYHDEVKNLRNKLSARHQAGEYNKCVFLCEKLIQLHKRNKNTRSMSYADDLFNLALVYEDLGKYQRAIGHYADSLRVVQDLTGISVDFADRLSNMAVAHNKAGEHLTALGMHSKALSVFRKRLGQDHPASVDSLCNLAYCMYDAKMYKNALKAHRQALELIRKRPAGPELSDCLNACGYCSEAMEDNAEAEGYYLEALTVIEKQDAGSEEHIACLLYLAEFWCKTGKAQEAVKGYNKAAKLIKNLGPGNHIHYAVALGGAAEAHEQLGDIKKSLALRLRSLGVMERTLGGNHLYFANMIKNIALGYGALGDNDNAIRLIKKTLRIKESLIGRHNESYARDVLALTFFYMERLDYKKITDTLKNFLKHVDFNDPEIPPYYGGMKELCRLTGEIAGRTIKKPQDDGQRENRGSAEYKPGELTELFRRISGSLELDLGPERP